MARTCLTLFLAFLCFSQVIYLNAFPITRSNSLVCKSQEHKVLENMQMENKEESMEVADATIRRMDAEINDYPGSGANNRHTPGHP
ncbi:hypothetical protein K7X08_000056 [Anisodus acutangulus]|uniref:Uncharacterized protein n=1 Tax=Anisodus acutangulus TaxID=402998 RepID=A0A9Q1M328_9SOLA|nr:hypothetical protein K7X08_000056 [Anisodus acutangulus]